MDEQSAVAPVQIPDRAHAVGPGWQELLTRLHQQLCALAPGYVLTGLKEKLGGPLLPAMEPPPPPPPGPPPPVPGGR